MRRSRRGRKLTAAVAAEAIEASAGLRPDQPITEAAVGRVLRHRSAGGLAHPSVVRKMAASPSVHSATLACRWAACVPIDPPRTTPNAVEIGTEKTPIIAATSWQRGQPGRSVIAPFPDAPSETRRQVHVRSVSAPQHGSERRHPVGPPGQGIATWAIRKIRADGFILPAGIARSAPRWTWTGELAARPARRP